MALTKEGLEHSQILWKALGLGKNYRNKSQKLQCSLLTLNRYHLQYGVIATLEVLPLLYLAELLSGRSRQLGNEYPVLDKSFA